ncbi:MAG: hydrogen gas-evolving membrane-bound hydrogenase subunit E [Pirellulaceae bacterium]
MPYYGDPEAPVHQHLAPEFLADTVPHVNGGESKVDVPNVITAVLASYRGYDTLGETVVIFTAGIGVLLLLRRRRDRNEEDDS